MALDLLWEKTWRLFHLRSQHAATTPQWVELVEQRNIESICYSIKSILALSRHTKFWVRSRSDRVKIIINRNNYFQNITIFWYYLYANGH